MNFSEQEKIRMFQEAEIYAYELYRIKMAMIHNDTWSQFHPDNIKKEISRLKRLLQEVKLT